MNEATPIPGYSSYSVTRDGVVYSHLRQRNGQWHFDHTYAKKLKRGIVGGKKKGDPPYLYVVIKSDATGKSRHISVHSLVLLTYTGPRPEGHVARHVNGDSLDNRIDNLSWGTEKENAADKLRHGTVPVGERCGGSVLTEKDVIAIRELYVSGELTQRELAKKFNTSPGNICALITGRTWTHVGGPRTRIGRPRGEQLGRCAKLTCESVAEIKKAKAAGVSAKSLAAAYSVTATTIHMIVAGRTWRHVECPAS